MLLLGIVFFLMILWYQVLLNVLMFNPICYESTIVTQIKLPINKFQPTHFLVVSLVILEYSTIEYLDYYCQSIIFTLYRSLVVGQVDINEKS